MQTNSLTSKKEISKEDKLKTIVIFSRTLDFCYSLLMFFQDMYQVTITTNEELLSTLVRTLDVDLIIVDAAPSQKMAEYFRLIKLACPDLPIILLYVYRSENQRLEQSIKEYVDAVFYKPMDIAEVTKRVNELVTKN